MKAKTYLQIPEPCHENWHNMQPTEQGKFCNACSKQVVDFSYMTDQQVLNYFNNHNHVCGRFNDAQLNRPLQPAMVQKKQGWWVVLTMPLLMLFDKSQAQKQKVATNIVAGDTLKIKAINPGLDIPPVEQYPELKITWGAVAHIGSNNRKKITGFVVDENNTPLRSAAVMLNKNEGVVTDTSGFFSLQVDSHKQDSIELHISHVGSETKNIKVSATDAVDNVIDAGIIQCKAQMMGLGDVVVVGYSTRSCKKTSGATSVKTYSQKNILDTVKNIFKDNFIKVFPNPVLKGSRLQVSFAKDDTYNMQLIDNNGRVVFLQQTAAIKDAVVNLQLPSNIAAGMYYIVAYGSDKKKHTTKLIIQ